MNSRARSWVDALIDLPFALPTAVAGIALTALDARNGWLGSLLESQGIKMAFTPLGIPAMKRGAPRYESNPATREAPWVTWTSIGLFVRRGKRLLGLTEPGKELLQIVERMLLDAKYIKRLAGQFSNSERGQLTIATTHTQARDALPQVVRRFKEAYPRVHLVTFARAGLTPRIVMSALDADVIRTYVGVGLGVGIVASMAFEAHRDQGLVLLPAQHIFEPNTTLIAVRRGHFLRGFAYRFLQECGPALTETHVREAVEPE